MIERDTTPTDQETQEAATRRQAQRLIKIAADFNTGLPELRKGNPQLAEQILREHREITSKIHRTPPESLRGMIIR